MGALSSSASLSLAGFEGVCERSRVAWWMASHSTAVLLQSQCEGPAQVHNLGEPQVLSLLPRPHTALHQPHRAGVPCSLSVPSHLPRHLPRSGQPVHEYLVSEGNWKKLLRERPCANSGITRQAPGSQAIPLVLGFILTWFSRNRGGISQLQEWMPSRVGPGEGSRIWAFFSSSRTNG